jgi:hypothetical protein
MGVCSTSQIFQLSTFHSISTNLERRLVSRQIISAYRSLARKLSSNKHTSKKWLSRFPNVGSPPIELNQVCRVMRCVPVIFIHKVTRKSIDTDQLYSVRVILLRRALLRDRVLWRAVNRVGVIEGPVRVSLLHKSCNVHIRIHVSLH